MCLRRISILIVLFASHLAMLGNPPGDCPAPLLLEIRVVLEGPFDMQSGLMNDDLRASGLLPATEPYSALGYVHVQGGGETVAPAVFQTTGNDAVVDWVVVEVRSATDPGRRLATRSALLQRDGDVRDLDNSSPVAFCLPEGDYFISIRHRNHLGIMSGRPVPIMGAASVDLGDPATEIWRHGSRKPMGQRMVMWAGDVNFNGTIQYTGQDNDRDVILSTIGGVVPTATVPGFEQGDVNLDGVVQYTGEGNDRDRVLQNIGGVVPTATRSGYLPNDTLVLRERVHVVDSLGWVLDSVVSNLADLSTLVYTFFGQAPDVLPDDIVASSTGYGYLRKVTSVGFAGSSMTLQTVQAYLTDVFLQGAISFSVDSMGVDSVPVNGFVPAPMYLSDLSSLNIELAAGVSIQNVGLDFDYKFRPKFEFGPNPYADVVIRDITASLSGALVIGAGAEVSIEEPLSLVEHTLWKRFHLIRIGGKLVIPVVTELKAVGQLTKLELGAAASLSVPVSLSLGMDAGFVYQNGSWYNVSSGPELTTSMDVQYSAIAEGRVEGHLGLQLSTTIWRLGGGPYVFANNRLNISGEYNLIEQDKNYEVTDSLDLGIRIESFIFKALLGEEPGATLPIPLARLAWPDTVHYVSGNGQTGAAGEPLAQPVRVRVQKVFENEVLGTVTHSAATDARVRFDVLSGGGSVSDPIVETDAGGYAECTWTLGQEGEQRLKAYVLLANGDTLQGGPIEFSAGMLQEGGCSGLTTVTDIDGNVYPVVQIGNQCWMAENLRVTKYSEGTDIPNVSNLSLWVQTNEGARREPLGGLSSIRGKLYNWYTTVDMRGVCPQGWHVPSDSEWMILESYLGMPAVELDTTMMDRGVVQNVGGKLKSTQYWGAPNTGATNESGFTGIEAGGFILTRDTISGVIYPTSTSENYYIWSSSENNLYDSLCRIMRRNSGGIRRSKTVDKRTGFSIRCLMD